MSFISKLQIGIYKLTGEVYANWTPQDPLDLGDIGRISGSRFQKDFNLKQRGFLYEENLDRQTGTSEFKRDVIIDGGGSVKASAEGPILIPGTQVEISMKFGSEGSFVYHVSDLLYAQFKDRQKLIRELGQNIISEKLRWIDDYVLIDEVRKGKTASIIVSDSSNVNLKFRCDVGEGEKGFLSKVGANFGATIKNAQIIHYLGLENPTLYYHPVQLDFDPGGGPSSVSVALERVKKFFGGKPIEPEKIRMVDYLDEPNRWLAKFSIADAGTIEMVGSSVELGDFISRESEKSEDDKIGEIETVPIQKILRAAG